MLLDLLTPCSKPGRRSTASKANDLAIQVLGRGRLYAEYPVEQCWRDNRLNPYTRGTNGIQALDLLGRKLWQANGLALRLLHTRMQHDITSCHPDNQDLSTALQTVLNQLALGRPSGSPDAKTWPGFLGLATFCYTLMGHTCVAWQWLRAANRATLALSGDLSKDDMAFYRGKIQAARYFYRWELPLLDRDFTLLNRLDDTCHTMQPDWF